MNKNKWKCVLTYSFVFTRKGKIDNLHYKYNSNKIRNKAHMSQFI